MNYSFRLVGALAITVALTVTSAQGAVSSWLSPVGSVGGGVAPGEAVVNLNAGESSSLYLWLRNTTTLRSVAYDIQAATAGVINLTDVEVYAPDLLVGGVTDIGDRWNLPVATGDLSASGQAITNFGAVNVDKSGLALATRTFDALYDVVADAALVAKINFTAVGGGSTALSLSEGLTKIVEAGNPDSPELTFSGATINVAADIAAPIISPLALNNGVLNGTVSGVVALDAASDPADSWGGNITFVGYTQAHGGAGETGVTQPAIAPTWNPATQAFSWDTSGSLRGDYVWQVTATNGGGDGTGTISVAQTAVPEPASLALLGLAAAGFAGIARRK